MEKLTGRLTERQTLLKALNSGRPELLAILGRRRVGKTFLVRKVLGENIILEFSGEHSGKMKTQLENFSIAINEYSKGRFKHDRPSNWTQAFEILKSYINSVKKVSKKVVFLDEFPWIDTRKSGFLSAFEYFWNSWCTKQNNLIIVICGSSASWMIRHIVNNRGGLHNRLSNTIRLQPFTLTESEEFLATRKISLDRYQLVQLYMVTGGIPFYLNLMEKGESAAQYIDRICFTKEGLLLNEFDNLYRSLFNSAGSHSALVKILAENPEGMTRDQLMNKAGFKSGGRFSDSLSELEESGFIGSFLPYGAEKKNKVFKLTDEFSFFYLKFMGRTFTAGQGQWLKVSAKQAWRTWAGFAWERICIKHIYQIKSALGISGIYSVTGSWRGKPDKKVSGAQIDILIDRDDHCINLCECKFSETSFTISNSYSEELKSKIQCFKETTGTKKTLLLTFITTYGLKDNKHSTGLVQKSLVLDDLFR